MASTSGTGGVAAVPSSKWLPLESNPEMLTQFIRQLGVKSPCRFVDIWSFDEDTITMFPQPIIAVCVLYPPDEVEPKRKSELKFLPADGKSCFFVKQRLEQHGNACGSIAMVHSICNNLDQLSFDPSSPLLEFGTKNKGLSAEKLADQLQNAVRLHAATGTVASMGQTATPDAEDEVNHHFIAFIRSDVGHLLELDGMKPGPVDHGPCTAENLFHKAVVIIRDEMMTKTSDVTFSALGLTLAPEDD